MNVINMPISISRGNNLLIFYVTIPTYLQNKINNNQSVSRSNHDAAVKELESIKTELELTNNKLKIVEEELSNEKSKNITLMNSYVTTLEKCKDFESDVLAGKVNLENKIKELENVLVEKSNIQKQYVSKIY